MQYLKDVVKFFVELIFGDDAEILTPKQIVDLKHEAQKTALQGQDATRNRDIQMAEESAAQVAQRDVLEAIDAALMLTGSDLSVDALFGKIFEKAQAVQGEIRELRIQAEEIENQIQAKTSKLDEHEALLAKLK